MNVRQFLKLLLIVLVFSGMSYGTLRSTSGLASSLFEDVLATFPFLATVFCAMSLAMFAYVDNVSKDFTELRTEVDRFGYLNAQEKLTGLKREVLLNGAMIICFLVLERVTKGAASYLTTQIADQHSNLIGEASLSFRVALLSASLWAATQQLRAFLVAAEFRDVIARNRK